MNNVHEEFSSKTGLKKYSNDKTWILPCDSKCSWVAFILFIIEVCNENFGTKIEWQPFSQNLLYGNLSIVDIWYVHEKNY